MNSLKILKWSIIRNEQITLKALRNEGQVQLKAPSIFKLQESAHCYIVDINTNHFL